MPERLLDYFRFARVRAALRAAAALPSTPFVRAALRAAAERSAELRFAAETRDRRDRAVEDAACVPSFFSALTEACERFGDGLAGDLARLLSFTACFRVFSETFPLGGTGRSTPALLALERPMAIACLADLAPCFPSRMCSIVSRTNSPAWVPADLPSCLALRALRMVLLSGMSSIGSDGNRSSRFSRTCYLRPVTASSSTMMSSSPRPPLG